MIILKEEFKAFVKTKPELISYVNDGSMTWQKFYEMWNLYGEDAAVWNKYPKKELVSNKTNTFSFSSLIDSIKNVDMDSVQKGVNNIQKAVELLQGFTVGKASNNTNNYEPRQIFKKFED